MKFSGSIFLIMLFLIFCRCGESGHTGAGAEYNCGSLPEDELDLFRTVYAWGASNTSADNYYYPARIIKKLNERLAGCLDYRIILTYTNGEPSGATSDVKLSISLDGFYYPASDHGNTDDLSNDIADKLDRLFSGISAGGYLIAGNVPGPLLYSYSAADREGILARISEEMENYPNAVLIDLDDIYDNILAGNFYYNGAQILLQNIMNDFLHLNSFGHQIMADLFIEKINEIWPNLDIPSWGVYEVRK